MDVFSDPKEVSAFIWRIKRNYHVKLWEESRAKPQYLSIVGFAPTMGALHEGHLSLVRRSVAENHFTVVSIFVNPLQFGPKEDYSRYPRPFEADLVLLDKEKVDLVFAPSKEELYRNGYQTFVQVRELTKNYCGKERPGHFEGVTTVVAKLFGIVSPDVAYFGEKDYQQFAAIKCMAEELDMQVRIECVPTVREEDGLAMSSRNKYLSAEERRAAPGFHRALRKMKEEFRSGIHDAHRLSQVGMAEMMKTMGLIAGFNIEYVDVADPDTLAKREMAACTGDLVLAAIRLGKTRLIDNIKL